MVRQIYNKHITAFIGSILLTSILLFAPNSVKAYDYQISCTDDLCTSDIAGGALFDESSLVPTGDYVRTLNVCNDADGTRTFAINLHSYTEEEGSFGDVLTITIVDHSNNDVLYGPATLIEFRDVGYVFLTEIIEGGCTDIDFTVSMANVGNEYQGLTLSFDLDLGFDSVAGVAPTPTPDVLGEITTPTPTTIPTPTPTEYPLSPTTEQTPTPNPTPSVLGDQLVNTGKVLVIPITVGLLILGGVVLSKKLRRIGEV